MYLTKPSLIALTSIASSVAQSPRMRGSETAPSAFNTFIIADVPCRAGDYDLVCDMRVVGFMSSYGNDSGLCHLRFYVGEFFNCDQAYNLVDDHKCWVNFDSQQVIDEGISVECRNHLNEA